jgi:hypothetical protein
VLIGGVGCAVGLLLVVVTPVLAECWPPPPSRDDRIPVKVAFTATVAEVSRRVDPPMADSAPFDWHLEFTLEKTYRGRVPDELLLNGWDVGCSFLRPAGLRAGDRVFITLDRLDLVENPSLFGQILIWRRGGDGWAFAADALQWGRDRAFWPAAARGASSLSEIVALVERSPLPDTATAPQQPDGAGSQAALALPLVLAFVVAFGAVLARLGGRARFRQRA